MEVNQKASCAPSFKTSRGFIHRSSSLSSTFPQELVHFFPPRTAHLGPTTPYNMSTEHHVQVPKAYWGLKIAQTVIAALVFALSCYEVAVIPSSYAGFTIFVVSVDTKLNSSERYHADSPLRVSTRSASWSTTSSASTANPRSTTGSPSSSLSASPSSSGSSYGPSSLPHSL